MTTYRGRVVYNRKRHFFTIRDVVRILLYLSGKSIMAAMHLLFGIAGDFLAQLLIQYRDSLVTLGFEIAGLVWQVIYEPLIRAGALTMRDLLNLIGYVPADVPPPTIPV